MKITVLCRAGTLEVEAEPFGDYAVHLSTGWGAPKWTVTHIATGLAAAAVSRKRTAEKIARHLRDNLTLPEGDPATVFAWMQEHQEDPAIRAIREFVFLDMGAERTTPFAETAEMFARLAEVPS